jgi:hypothetical protein
MRGRSLEKTPAGRVLVTGNTICQQVGSVYSRPLCRVSTCCCITNWLGKVEILRVERDTFNTRHYILGIELFVAQTQPQTQNGAIYSSSTVVPVHCIEISPLLPNALIFLAHHRSVMTDRSRELHTMDRNNTSNSQGGYQPTNFNFEAPVGWLVSRK